MRCLIFTRINKDKQSDGHGVATSYPWIKKHFTGLTATIEQMRTDRQLEEALSSDPDPLHLAAVFGVSHQTAIRYAHAARQLLTE
jgi:hypothetical protein